MSIRDVYQRKQLMEMACIYRYRNKIGRNETFLDEMKQVGHVMREGRLRGRRLIGSCTRAVWQLVSTREIVSRELDEMKQLWTKLGFPSRYYLDTII